LPNTFKNQSQIVSQHLPCNTELLELMALLTIKLHRFLELAENIPVIDVRSPSEFFSGHIPEAVNIPLFDDDSRAVVGIKFKKEGRIPAIIEGLNQAGPDLSLKLSSAIKYSKKGKLLVHCWRGGMRSEAMAWLFSLADIEVYVLEGGYKTYRTHVLSSLAKKRKTIILGGMTGSSKTHILKYIKTLGHKVIDLEGLANHKGSAFGSLGQPAQPSTEHFANLLYDEWNKFNEDIPVWMEDESRNIGSVFIPDNFYLNMQDSPTIVLVLDIVTRMPRLLEEYSKYPAESLISSIMRISKRLGGDATKSAIKAIQEGDFDKAIEITLNYYDKAYLYGLKRKVNANLIYVNSDSEDIETNALKVIEAARLINW
jgi:tRNA 2-selenouridine synthase